MPKKYCPICGTQMIKLNDYVLNAECPKCLTDYYKELEKQGKL